jgi:hypothetical protein
MGATDDIQKTLSETAKCGLKLWNVGIYNIIGENTCVDKQKTGRVALRF